MTPLQTAAQHLIDRWDSPLWKDQPHTGVYIAELRKTLEAEQAQAANSRIGFLYEELRKAIDEGSESMTHDDALKQIAYWQDKCNQVQAVEPCKGLNCGSLCPKLHSAECFDEHEALARCQRPFGYFHFVFDSDNGDYWRETDDESEMPLFTHPAPPAQQVAVPMPESQIDELSDEHLMAGAHYCVLGVVEFVRAIEAHHGIGAKPVMKPDLKTDWSAA